MEAQNDDGMSRLPSDDEVIVEAEDAILVVTLNRPSRANALTESLMRSLRALWEAVRTERWIRCVIVTGAGKAFCGGADVAMLAETRRYIGETAAEELRFLPGPHLDVPVIAAVNGVCAGGGLHFVSDADICIAAETARFIDPHVTVGQVSGMEPLELMLKMRRDAVVRMALLGSNEVVNAARALEVGLVSELVPPERLRERAIELGRLISRGSPEALRRTRAAIRGFEADLLRQHLDGGWRSVQEHWAHPDSKEGPAAFREGRTPRWRLPGEGSA